MVFVIVMVFVFVSLLRFAVLVPVFVPEGGRGGTGATSVAGFFGGPVRVLVFVMVMVFVFVSLSVLVVPVTGNDFWIRRHGRRWIVSSWTTDV